MQSRNMAAQRKQALMRCGKLSSLVPKLNVYKSNYFESISSFDEHNDTYLTVREPSGSCKYRCRSVQLKKKRIFDFETMYFKLFEKCIEYNHSFSKCLDLDKFLKIEKQYASESVKITAKYFERPYLKLLLMCCRVFFDQVQYEWKMDFTAFYQFLIDRTYIANKIVKGQELDKLFNIMVKGQTVNSFHDGSVISMRCYEDLLLFKLFKKDSVFVEMYLKLMFDFTFDIHVFFTNVRNCSYFNESVFKCMVWAFLIDVHCDIPKDNVKENDISILLNLLCNDKFTSVNESPGPAWGHYETYPRDTLENIDKLMKNLFTLSSAFNFHDLYVNASILVQIRSELIGLNFENASLYKFCLYLKYFKKFFNYVVDNLIEFFGELHVKKLLPFRTRDKYRNEHLRIMLKNKGHEQLASEWNSGSEMNQEVHSWIAPFVDEERFLWASAILPFFVELMFLCLSERSILKNIEKPRHVGGK